MPASMRRDKKFEKIVRSILGNPPGGVTDKYGNVKGQSAKKKRKFYGTNTAKFEDVGGRY